MPSRIHFTRADWRSPYRAVAAGAEFDLDGHATPRAAPGAEGRAYHRSVDGELLKREFREDTRREFISLVSRLRDEDGIDGVILGGTEGGVPIRVEKEMAHSSGWRS